MVHAEAVSPALSLAHASSWPHHDRNVLSNVKDDTAETLADMFPLSVVRGAKIVSRRWVRAGIRVRGRSGCGRRVRCRHRRRRRDRSLWLIRISSHGATAWPTLPSAEQEEQQDDDDDGDEDADRHRGFEDAADDCAAAESNRYEHEQKRIRHWVAHAALRIHTDDPCGRRRVPAYKFRASPVAASVTNSAPHLSGLRWLGRQTRASPR